MPPAQLPADLPTFAGREWELSQLSAMLRPGSEFPGTVAIHVIGGMAGIGKTTFAIHWAHHVAKHFEDGQLYLNLHGFDSSDSATAPVDALRALLYSLGVPPWHIPGDPDARAGLYRSVLAGKRILIVLDNARDVEQVRPLLPGSPGCLVIATSRNPRTGLAMTEGARLLTLHLPSVLTARETLERRPGRGRTRSGGNNYPVVRTAAAGSGHRVRAGRRPSRLHACFDRRRPPAHAGPPRRIWRCGRGRRRADRLLVVVPTPQPAGLPSFPDAVTAACH